MLQKKNKEPKAPQKQQTKDVPIPPPQEVSPTMIKKQKNIQKKTGEKQRQKYSQAVYTTRFTHFRVLRLASWSIGVLIYTILCFGLWNLYNTVFDTIANKEALFFVQEVKRTDLIHFQNLEKVREDWKTKQSQLSTSTIPVAIFGTSTPPLDTTGTEVEE